MESINRTVQDEIVIEKVNLIRATMNEAFEMKETLNEDMFDFNKIIVDLTSCDYIDSTFLGALVYSLRRIKEQNGTIALVISDNFLSKSFIYHEISSVFRVYYSIKEAVAGLTEEDKKEKITEEH